eukprot:12932449-Prorocentrum_lima.AAC.1
MSNIYFVAVPGALPNVSWKWLHGALAPGGLEGRLVHVVLSFLLPPPTCTTWRGVLHGLGLITRPPPC